MKDTRTTSPRGLRAEEPHQVAGGTGSAIMTRTDPPKTPAPRELGPAGLREAAGGRGLLIICVEHKGQETCRLV